GVGALVAHVSRFEGQRLRELVLDGQVPGVERRQFDLLWSSPRENTVRQLESARLRVRLREDWRRRTRSERKYAVEIARRVETLRREHRQVLRHRMAENRAEDSDVVAPPIAHTDDGLVLPLVGDAQARREMLIIHLIVAAEINRSDAAYAD